MTPVPFHPVRDGWPGGPRRLLVVGPPGTGKTRCALECFLLPVLLAGIPPEKILCCSFSRAAALELRRRLAAALGWPEERFARTCSTIHARALQILRHYGRGVCKVRGDTPEARFDEPTGATRTPTQAGALRAWELARARCVSLRAVGREAAPEYEFAELEAVVKAYEAEKAATDEIDFADMISRAASCPATELELLVVDEGQDCSEAQWRLVDHWAAAAKTVVLVGDPDQAIHEWAGADPRRFLAHAEAGYELRWLVQSHRLPRAPHALARGLILKNGGRCDAAYEPAGRSGDVRDVEVADALRAVEAAARARREVLVLARARSALGAYARALAERGVPFINERGFCPLDAPDAVARARAVCGLRERQPVDVADLLELLHSLPAATFPDTKAEALNAVEALSGPVRPSDVASLGVAVEHFLEARDLRESFRLADLGSRAQHLARLVERHGVEALSHRPVVTLTTMHRAKGREADLVVVDMAAPTRVRKAAAEQPVLAAERRVLYVALTRTKDELLLVRPRRHGLGQLLGLPQHCREVDRAAQIVVK